MSSSGVPDDLDLYADTNNSSLKKQPQEDEPVSEPQQQAEVVQQQDTSPTIAQDEDNIVVTPQEQAAEEPEQIQPAVSPVAIAAPSPSRSEPPKPRQQDTPHAKPAKGPQYDPVTANRDYSKSPAQLAYPDRIFDSDCTISYRDICCKLSLPKDFNKVKNNISPCVKLAKAIGTCGKSCAGTDFYRIKNASGIIRPGTMTLVLSGPGMGKSSFLRLLSNRIPLTSGTVAYNGRTFDAAAKEDCDLRKMTQYVDQVDTHLPLLTVFETLDFAHQLTSVNYDPQRVEDAISLLGLEECRNTIVGNAMIRGISGGQKKRVSVGELLISDASTLFLDEFTNGLDASTAEDIGVGLKKFCLKYNSSVVATLQQPTPELFALFDRIIILNEGQILFDGPTNDAIGFFEGMGFHQPDDIDASDFIIDCLSQPRSVILRQREEELLKQKSGKKSSKHAKSSTIKTSYGPIQASPTPCITTEEMIDYYQTTPFWKEIKDELDAKIPDENSSESVDLTQFKPLMPTEDAKLMYRVGYRLPITTLLGRVTVRQVKLFTRNTATMIPRIVMAFFMSLIYGSLYWNIQTDEYVLRLASFVICVSQIAFGNFVEIPISAQAVLVIKKQLSARFYPAWTYSVAALIMSAPMSAMEASIYSLFLYFMTNAYLGAAEFFVFWCIGLLTSLQLSTWFRFLAAIGGDEATSQSLAGPTTGLFTIFGGLFISRSNIPNFMIWLYWFSPFSWTVRALSNNEFLTSRYDALIPVTQGGNTVLKRVGDLYLETIDMYIGSEWILWCCLFLVGLSIVTVFVNQFLLTSKFYEESIGTRRSEEQEIIDGELDFDGAAVEAVDNDDALLQEQVKAAALQQAQIQSEASHTGSTAASSTGASRGASSAQSSFNPNSLKTLRENLPFAPAWLSFSDVSYTVKVKKDNEMVDRALLNNVNGYAQPGKMLALMGASGAGKTTLLDVLAGLKNTGVIQGKILINGQPATAELLSSMTGYVEQFDTLFPFETVRETLEFAARLRLPYNISDEIKMKIVEEIIEILDLGSMAGFIIGNHKIQGLSPAQRKRVSIGVELVANPAVLFLDEPSTGLDSKSAQTVLKVVKRIARSGRSVICTIHQPNSELFFMFDRLLLLGAGGYQIYFGDLGRRAKTFIDYLSRCPGVTPIQLRINPASWMLVELGVGVASEKGDMEAQRGRIERRTDTFEVDDDPEWANLDPTKVTVQRFKKLYLQSTHFKAAEKRLRVLESIEVINSDDKASFERYQKEVEMATLKRSAPKGAVIQKDPTDESSVNTSKTSLPTTTILISRSGTPPWYYQLRYLYARNFSAYWRNGSFIYARLTVITILSIIFGLTYLGVQATDVASTTSLIGATFMGNIFSAITHCSTAIPVFFEQRPTFYREKAAKYYYPVLWAVCQLGIEMVYMVLGLIVTQIPVYFLVGLDLDAGIFFSYSLATYLLIAVYVTVAMWIASISPNSGAAGVLVGAYMSFQSAVAGIAITLPNIPAGYVWLYYGLPGSHIFRAIIMPQFINNTNVMTIVQGTQEITISVKQYVSDYLGWDYDGYWVALGWALLFLVVLQIISFIATTFLSFNQR